ncbi:hypothetical protein [Streptomyces sp. NBC_01190]|uniref:hypothetical protein n=1 Tax=Streptomyces sp. NBC_01190 TaxID=2903767 RepID=UPI00386F04B2|nr:hypothetical protein OG519_18490 [Streptomyces sp. NBC_01190]
MKIKTEMDRVSRMNFEEVFLRCYANVLGGDERLGEADPEADVQSWLEFVEECESGYSDSLSEYDFDLYVRDRLQKAIDSQALHLTSDYDDFRRMVESIDGRFREIASTPISADDGESPNWWHKIIPHKGGEEFVNDVRDRLGLIIRRVD